MRTIGYARLSTAEQAEGQALEQQIEEHTIARHAACETVAAVQAKLKAGMDEVHYKSSDQ